MPIPTFDLIMAAVLAVIVTGISRIHCPIWKSFVYSCPIPFSLAFLVSGRGVDSGHIVGIVLNNLFLWGTWYLHKRRRVPILATDLIAASVYVALTSWLVRALPEGNGYLFYGLIAAGLTVSIVVRRFPPRAEEGAVSPMPVWMKASVVFVLALCLYSLKNVLLAAMTTFPYLGVFTVVECRRSLYTLAVRFAHLSAAFYVLVIVVRWRQDDVPLWAALLIGWLPALGLLAFYQFRGTSRAASAERA